MYSYTITQWLFFFYFYCFIGWCFESAYVSIKSRKLTNRGFMRGPFLPIYGSGAIMMLVVSMPFQDSLILTYVAGCIGATILEYVTGVTMEALFKVRYWDYSQNKFNFQGHICLGSSLAWGLLTILMTEFIHVPVERFVLSIPGGILTAVTFVLTAGIFADFALSFKAAINLRDILSRMEQAKEDMVRIQKRLDVIIAVAEEEMAAYKDAVTESVTAYRNAVAEGVAARKDALAEGMTTRMADLKTGIDNRMESLKKMAQSKSGGYMESIREELLDLRTRYAVSMEKREYHRSLKDFFQRSMIRSNPGMTSRKYREALEELKQNSEESWKKRQDLDMSEQKQDSGDNK